MPGKLPAQDLLKSARISCEIFTLRPDYRALLMIVEGIPLGPSTPATSAMLEEAETHIKTLTIKTPIPSLPHIASWRETYKSFGAKPNKTRNSLEALTRRAETGLPRVNRLTDIYNAISVKHQIPIGGEDLDKYVGAPFLVRASGTESFQTFSGGEPQVECAVKGEPVWCDEAGVTCRRWNWRQGPRTALTDETSRVLFILDALEPVGDAELQNAADELGEALRMLSPDVRVVQRVIGASS